MLHKRAMRLQTYLGFVIKLLVVMMLVPTIHLTLLALIMAASFQDVIAYEVIFDSVVSQYNKRDTASLTLHGVSKLISFECRGTEPAASVDKLSLVLLLLTLRILVP